MRPFAEMTRDQARAVRYVLFDIDDTITEHGKLPAASYNALWDLSAGGLRVVPVTGRPAGWCDLIARQWPVDGVIGENGAFAFHERGGTLRRRFHPSAPDPESTKERLRQLGQEAVARIPGLRIAKDQPYRMFDVALDFAEEEPDLGLGVAEMARRLCEDAGARAKVSSIHVNAWFGDYDKLSMSELFLTEELGWDPAAEPDAVLFFGDSPNDEPMFARFSLSCGVANIRKFEGTLRHPPRWVTSEPFGRGFAEACALLREKRAR